MIRKRTTILMMAALLSGSVTIATQARNNRESIQTAITKAVDDGKKGHVLVADNATIDCGQVMFKNPTTATFEITNTSNSPVTIDKVRTSCGCAKAEYPKGTISAGKTFTVSVTYDAKQLGHFQKKIGIYTRDAGKPLMLTMSGLVVSELIGYTGNYDYVLGVLKADKRDIEFDDVTFGEMPTEEIHIQNNSGQTAHPVVMHLPSYLKAEVSPSTLLPGRSGVIRVQLDSREISTLGLTQTSVYVGFQPGDKVSADKEVTVSAVLLPNLQGQDNASVKTGRPRVRMSMDKLSLGGAMDKKKNFTVVIENMGNDNLVIENAQMFTPGMRMQLNTMTIAPGAQAKMKITCDVKVIRQQHTRPRVLLVTNDPDNPKIILEVTD